MGEATYLRSNFHGGEWSKSFQGRVDRPDYVTALSVCLNGFPIESGAYVRRPGTRFAGTTRGGRPGREVKFDFKIAAPYNMEFTDGHLCFRSDLSRITTNDSVGVVSISAAIPAVVQTAAARSWATGDQGYFTGLGSNSRLLQARAFTLTAIDTTHFSLSDPITGAAIDGSTVALALSPAVLNRILDIPTPYGAGIWSSLRSVQTESPIGAGAFLLNGSVAPNALLVTRNPTPDNFAAFALNPAVFNDGPYLDPFTNGVQANPSAKVGIIAITLSFPAYVGTIAYAAGAFVTSASVNYRSLADQNVGNTPVASPTKWQAVDAGTAISPAGFQGSDVGRLVRLFSEPPLWDVAATYAANAVVSFNPSGRAGETTYWTSLVGANTGKQPGLDLTNWTLTPQGAAIWSWGKIVSLANATSGVLAGSANFGDLTAGGGLAAAFDGNPTKTGVSSASKTTAAVNVAGYIGKDYSGATDQKIGSATIHPASDQGFTSFSRQLRGPIETIHPRFILNLRAKATPPAGIGDGTLLGTTGPGWSDNTVAAVTIQSNDTTTAWKYVWVEIAGEGQDPASITPSYSLFIGQVELFKPLDAGATTSNGINVEILGAPLLYTSPVRTWRLGVYSNTTGWPTCGTYHEGRLWLSGVVANRIDACVSNGILGGTVNWAPTDQYGTVSPASAISYVFNAPDANPIFWMMPDLKGIICGTQGGEWLVHPPTPGSLSPFNISAQRNTNVKCANIEPRRTEHTTVFVQAYRRKVLEYFDDIYSGKFTGPNLSETAKHLTVGNVDELGYQQELCPIVWARVAGRLVGCTYKRDTPAAAQRPSIAGWHRHTLGSGGVLESLCVGPSVDGGLDSLSLVTFNTDGARHVEVMTNIPDEDAALADCWYLDSAVEPTSTAQNLAVTATAPFGGLSLYGLWHLNGRTVTVMAGGLDCGDYLVTDGAAFVPFGDGVAGGTGSGLFTPAFAATARIIVGFTYTSDGQIVRPNAPAESGARNGPAFGKKRRSDLYMIQLESTRGLSVGTKFTKLRPIGFKSDAGRPMAPLETFTGIHVDTLEDDYSFDGMLCWRQTRPFPANVVAIGAAIKTSDV